MRILFIAHATSIHSYRWVKYFAEIGSDICWVSLVPSEFPAVDGVEFHEFRCGRRPSDVAAAALGLRRLIRASRPDVLHVHYVGLNGVLAASTWFHPMVATAWGSDILKTRRRVLTRLLVRHVLAQADLVTCDAEHMIQAMVELGAPREKIHRINFGMDTNRFVPGAGDGAVRRQLGLEDAPIVISLRNLEPVYDVGSLVRAAPLVLRQQPATRFLIAGTGSQEQPLRRLAESLGVADAVRFLGRLSNDQLPSYLAASDVYVSTALSDGGIAASTAEAMACGLPVVITDFGENREWVRDGEGGFLVPLRSPAVLADRIVRLLRTLEMRVRAGEINRRVIEERNDYRTEMGKMAALYRQLVRDARA